ncbi:MAG: response regulator [Lachnospiraceae bacterium]|jgi:signal transduction histidine kinase/CheY-like chemotaxis protein|nr:response regulator [Lachnospiraceae bacterium]
MKEKQSRSRKNRGISLFIPILLVFSILGAVVFSVSQKISREMSASAIQNLSESLNLIKSIIEAVLRNEAEFQTMIAREVASTEDPEEYIRSYGKNQMIAKVSLIQSGQTQGVSNTGENFSGEALDFTQGGEVNGLPISESYVNYMGAWAYSMKCPVEKDGQEIATLYIEYVYDFLDRSLPDGFYNQRAMLYIMDAETQRFVLKPKGMGKRSAGHLNLEDFYRANSIEDEKLQKEVADCLENNRDLLFYHNIQGVQALNYMWAVNGGTIFLVGYVPIEAIQQEGRTVNQNIYIVVAVMLVAFFVCCVLYYWNQSQQNKIRSEREAEREIHNKQLAEALQAAQIANHSKTTFLSNMSHDIRTPMNAVLGFTKLLSMDAENPVKVREYTKKIMASGQHLLSLINDVLDVSKIESGKVVLAYERFTLNDLVSSVDAIIQPMAKAKHQNFYVEVRDIKHEYLIGDEMRVNQVLINLLSNAVKYTPDGGNIWFRIIGLKQRSGQYEHIRIEVQDDGYGMTPEYLTTIFDAFTRAENSTTNKVQGTGLGMAITKNIVELMGGTIEVFSEVNKGSLFRVELEFRIPEDQADKRFWKENGISRILVVNRDEQACKNIRLLMEEAEILVDTADDEEEAIQVIRDGMRAEKNYHVILMDWCPQGAERDEGARKVGEAAAKAVRETLPDRVPLIFLTDFDANGVESVLQIKNTGILTKPFFVSALKDKIQELQMGDAEKEYSVQDNSLEGLHFLAAEDNEINAEILTELLDMEGASCEIVENGQRAVERFQNADPAEFDAILMDVQMPVMNGYEATKAIRALDCSRAKEIPIIAMTANAFAEDEKAALDAGMNAHVAKPLDIELLKAVIRAYR